MTMKMTSLNLSLMLLVAVAASVSAKSVSSTSSDTNNQDDGVNAVIPSPNQEFGDSSPSSYDESDDVVRRTPEQVNAVESTGAQEAAAPSNEASVPIYVSPYVRPDTAAANYDNPQESNLAPLNYLAPRPSATASITPAASAPQLKDLKASASYGHHHGHHGGHGGGYGHSGWLDMGAWTGGKGSFGWYADYPVGSKHGYGYHAARK